jgi:hypothetical protein
VALIRLRKPSVAWVAAVIFGAIGLFASWVGLLDFLSAANLQYKLTGLAFAVAGLVLLTGSAVLVRDPWRRTHGRVAAVAAGVAGVFVGGYLLLMQYRAPGLSPSRLPPFPAWVPWAGIVVASVAGALLGWRSTKDHAAEQVTWTVVGGRLFAGGLSLTLLLSGVQWWYTQQYQPGTIAAALTVTTELRPSPATTAESAGDMPNPHMFEGTITIKNVSDTKVQIVASLYQVTKVTHGLRTPIPGINGIDRERQAVACFLEELAPVTDPECDQPGIYEYGQFSAGDPRAQDDFAISRTSRLEAAQTLQLGHIVVDGSWLEPEQAFEHNVLVHVPGEEPSGSPALKELQLSAWLAVAQGSRLVLERVPSHGPEMVPQARMSNEEYRDYKQAEEAVQRDGWQDRDSAAPATDEPDTTVEVDVGRRDTYYQELTTPRSPDEAVLPVGAEPERLPRPYPHRYTVVEWPIQDLSALHQLAWGSHVVNTVQVLSMRLYDPQNSAALVELEQASMATCVSPAGTLKGKSEESEIRRDPTAVCPGMWYSLADDEGRMANSYERRYQMMADYGEEMAAFYGLILTGSADVVSLTTAAEAVGAAAAMPTSPHVHPLPSDVFEECEPALQSADILTRGFGSSEGYGNRMQRAFDQLDGDTRSSTGDANGSPTLEEGLEAAGYFDAYFEGVSSALLACSATDAPGATPAASCAKAAAAEIEALRYAHDLGVALREAEVTGTSLDSGREASQAYQRARDEAGRLLAECR